MLKSNQIEQEEQQEQQEKQEEEQQEQEEEEEYEDYEDYDHIFHDNNKEYFQEDENLLQQKILFNDNKEDNKVFHLNNKNYLIILPIKNILLSLKNKDYLGFDNNSLLNIHIQFNKDNKVNLIEIFQSNLCDELIRKKVPIWLNERIKRYLEEKNISIETSQLVRTISVDFKCSEQQAMKVLNKSKRNILDAALHLSEFPDGNDNNNDNNKGEGLTQMYCFVDRIVQSSPNFKDNVNPYTNIFNHIYHLIIGEIQTCFQRCLVCNEAVLYLGREIPQACQKEDCQRVCNLGLTIDPEQEMLKLFEVDLKISVFVQSYLSNTSNFIQKFPTITMITNSSNLIETIHRIPTVQLMNRWARSNSLKQNLNAIDPFIYPLLIWILAHPQNIIRKIQYDKIPAKYIFAVDGSIGKELNLQEYEDGKCFLLHQFLQEEAFLRMNDNDSMLLNQFELHKTINQTNLVKSTLTHKSWKSSHIIGKTDVVIGIYETYKSSIYEENSIPSNKTSTLRFILIQSENSINYNSTNLNIEELKTTLDQL